MDHVTLTHRGLTTSALGLGCADLFRLPSRSDRRGILEAAYAAGIHHFDVAPMYGLGLAERELGDFLRGRRQDAFVTTKFGISPTAAARVLARVQGPLRAMLGTLPGAREQVRSAAAGPNSGPAGRLLYKATGYSAAAARRSLERSLRDLGTDYVDLLLLHDPAPDTVPSQEIRQFLEASVEQGAIRAWGVAGEPADSRAVASGWVGADFVLQVRDDVFNPRLPGGDGSSATAGSVITFGVLGQALTTIKRYFTDAPDQVRVWSERIGVDCSRPDTLGTLLLREARRRNPEGVVLFGSVNPARIAATAAAIDAEARRPADSLVAFRDCLAELPRTRSSSEV